MRRPYSIAQLGHDALAIRDTEGIATAHVCGLSLGGITALWLAVHARERVRSLTTANTGARVGSAEFAHAHCRAARALRRATSSISCGSTMSRA